MRERRKLNRVDVANRTYRPPRSRPRGRPVAFSAAVAGTAESARFHLWCVGSRFRPRWSSPGWSGAGVGSVRRVLHDRAATEPGPTRFCVWGIRPWFPGRGLPATGTIAPVGCGRTVGATWLTGMFRRACRIARATVPKPLVGCCPACCGVVRVSGSAGAGCPIRRRTAPEPRFNGSGAVRNRAPGRIRTCDQPDRSRML